MSISKDKGGKGSFWKGQTQKRKIVLLQYVRNLDEEQFPIFPRQRGIWTVII